MLAHRIETTIKEDRSLTLDNLPFLAGESVEVIVLSKSRESEENKYSLRGKPVQFINPTEPVAQNDWEVTQ